MSSHSHVVYKSSKNYNNTDTSLGRNMMRSARQAPYLERKKEHDLALQWKNKRDDDAMHQIAAAHMRLVISIASRFKRFKMPLGDLVQE
ncbi:MAG: RNA polymerase factor sigma-32, partial [Bartonella sp.]|nr:RNA polymerase factor sigma-32 [Bartonella sp.]